MIHKDGFAEIQVAKFKDIQEAANAIVSESYRLWLQYETRTDDITIIILKLNGLEFPKGPSMLRGTSRKNLNSDTNALA